LSSVTAIVDQQATMAQKRKQGDAGMKQPDKNQWFWRYKQCLVCNSWGFEGQDGHMHKVYYGGGIFQDQYVCAKCWSDRMGKIVKKTDKEPDDDVDDEDDEKAGPSKKSKGSTTLESIHEAMEVDE